jgi:hypothetical protein
MRIHRRPLTAAHPMSGAALLLLTSSSFSVAVRRPGPSISPRLIRSCQMRNRSFARWRLARLLGIR